MSDDDTRTPPTTLNLFATFRATAAFWEMDGASRRGTAEAWRRDLEGAVERVEIYQVYPARGDADLLAWAAGAVESDDAPDRFLHRFARAVAPHRPWFTPGPTLWGLTRPSEYVRRASSTTIEPLRGDRLPYLIVYPFVKPHGWYALEPDERRRLMGEHIRVGREYGDVNQLLLYSFGLQDQDFVVVYETRSLERFSRLVHELRGTEARGYTDRDTPIFCAAHRPGDHLAEILGG